MISVVVPFLAYAPAQYFGFSGVLAVVTAGVYANRFTPRVVRPATRVQVIGFWNTLVFLANALLFLVVGLQLREVAQAAFFHNSVPVVLGYAVAVNVVLLAVRFAGTLLAEYLPGIGAGTEHAAPDPKHALIAAWSGLRGAVSLAAAIAIPEHLPGGAGFPHRDLIIFITFSVILVTLVGGGLTLPALIRALHLTPGGDEEREEKQRALVVTAGAALDRIGELERAGTLDAAHAQTLRTRFEHRREINRAAERGRDHLRRHFDVERELVEAQRDALIDLRERGEVDNAVLREIQAELDLAETRPNLAE